LNILDQRQKKIEFGLKAAEENLKTKNELEETTKESLNKARKDSAQILAQSKKDASKEAADVLAKAKVDAKKILDKERQAMAASFEEEKAELESQFSKMVTQTSEVLLKKFLSKVEQQKILDAQIKELKGIKFS
jgi:F-type H+-transporting ATPase subunit b